MADMSNIASFENSDGLPPLVVQKLNNNFWHVVSKITDPEIVAVSGVTPPSPRTDETLFYDTSTGDMYIWGQYYPPGHDTPEWGWVKLDLGAIRVEQDPPASDEPTTLGEVIWYSLNSHQFYILTSSAIFDLPLRWWSLETYIYLIATTTPIPPDED